MLIYKNIDSVWINTIEGVTVYFSYNHLAGYMSGYVRTPCGVSQIQTFGKCDSIEDGRKQLSELKQEDANQLFNQILDWEPWRNRDEEIENYKMVSLTEPIEFNNK